MKTYEKIRNIRTTHSGDRFAVAEFKARIQLWDLTSGLIRVIETEFDDFGISASGKYLAVGNYDKNSLTMYSVDTGKILWTRKDLKKVGRVLFFELRAEYVFVTAERQATEIISPKTGKTIQKVAGAESLLKLGSKSRVVIEEAEQIRLVGKDFTEKRALPKRTFAILGGAYSDDKLFVSYSGGPLEAFDLTSLDLLWTHSPPSVYHFLEVGFNARTNKVLGIRWNYIRGGSKFLCVLNCETGKMERSVNLGSAIKHSFLKEGKYLLTSTGKLISTADGKTKKKFDFENN